MSTNQAQDKPTIFMDKPDWRQPVKLSADLLKTCFSAEKTGQEKVQNLNHQKSLLSYLCVPFKRKKPGRLQALSNHQNKPGF
jgi:hypothetical protein